MLDNEQIKLSLTDDRDVLDTLRRRGMLVKAPDKNGEIYELQFDSVPIQFRLLKSGERTISPCSGRMARALIRDSATLVGDPLTGDHKAAVVEMGRYHLSDGDPALRMTKTTCPFCKEETGDARALANHLLRDCQHPDAGVPSVLKAKADAEKARLLKEDERVNGPSQEKINARQSVPAGTIREPFLPIAPIPAPLETETLDEVAIEDEA